MAKRVQYRIELTASAKQMHAKLSDHHGMTEMAMMSRVLEWVTAQSEPIQAVCLGRYPAEIAPDVARLLLKQMGDP
jgi:hypothetical protein